MSKSVKEYSYTLHHFMKAAIEGICRPKKKEDSKK